MCVLFIERDDTSEYILPELVVKLTSPINNPDMTYTPIEENKDYNKSYAIFNDLSSFATSSSYLGGPPIEVGDDELIICESPPKTPNSSDACSSDTNVELGKRINYTEIESEMTPPKRRKNNRKNKENTLNTPSSPPSNFLLPPTPPKTPFRVREFALEKNFGKPIEVAMFPSQTMSQPLSPPASPVTIKEFLTSDGQGKKICRKEIIINLEGARNDSILHELQPAHKKPKCMPLPANQKTHFQRVLESIKTRPGQIVVAGPQDPQGGKDKNLFIITRVPTSFGSSSSSIGASQSKYTFVEIPKFPGVRKNLSPVSISDRAISLDNTGALVLTNNPRVPTNSTTSLTPLPSHPGQRISMARLHPENINNNELENNRAVQSNSIDKQMAEESEIITIEDSDTEDSPDSNIPVEATRPTSPVNTVQSVEHMGSQNVSTGNINNPAGSQNVNTADIPTRFALSPKRIESTEKPQSNTSVNTPGIESSLNVPTPVNNNIEFISVPTSMVNAPHMDDPLGINSMNPDPLYTPRRINETAPAISAPSTSATESTSTIDNKEAARLRSLKCFCGRGFKYRNNLEVHRKMHRCRDERTESNSTNQDFNCPHCNWKTHTNFKLYLHMKRYHESAMSANKETEALEVSPDVTSIIRNPRTEQDEDTSTPNLDNIELNSNGYFKCQLCKKPFSTKERLAKHIEETCRLDRYKCKSCDYACPSQKYLKSHLKFVHSNKRPAS